MVEPRIEEGPGGFSSGCGTADHIFILAGLLRRHETFTVQLDSIQFI